MTDRPIMTKDEQPFVQVLRSQAGLHHLAVDNRRACELRDIVTDTSATVAELEQLPPDTPTSALCPSCFELGRGA